MKQIEKDVSCSALVVDYALLFWMFEKFYDKKLETPHLQSKITFAWT